MTDKANNLLAWTDEDSAKPWGCEVAFLRHLANDPVIDVSRAAMLRHCADRIEVTAERRFEAGGTMDAILAAYKTWPEDIRQRLSLHDLRRMTGWSAPPSETRPAGEMPDREIDALLGGIHSAYSAGADGPARLINARQCVRAWLRTAPPLAPDAVTEGEVEAAVENYMTTMSNSTPINKIGPRDALQYVLTAFLAARQRAGR